MRILHVGKFYPPFHGGIENFLAALIGAQSVQGHQVAALVHAHTPGGPPTYPSPGDALPWIIRAPCYGRLLYAPLSPTFPFWLNRAIKDFRPDILHFHLPNTSAFWALAIATAQRIPWAVHWHSDVVQSSIDRRLALAYRVYRPFEQALLRRASAIIATSPPYLEFSSGLRDWQAKCHVVPLGLPFPQPSLDNTAAGIEWKPGLLKVLAIGRLTYYKGFDTLIRAVAQAPFAQAIVVGQGDQGPWLRALLAASGAVDRVTFVGNLTDSQMQRLQDNCDVFCLPSLERTEAFGVVLLEAMQRAKPIIASSIPGSGVAWVVQHGHTGLLFPPGDADALAACLRAIQDSEGKGADFGLAGRRRFDEHFRIEQVVAGIDLVYRAISGRAW